MFHDLFEWLKSKFSKNKASDEVTLKNKKQKIFKSEELEEVSEEETKPKKRKKKARIKARATLLSTAVGFLIIVWWMSMLTARVLTKEVSLTASFEFTSNPFGINLMYDIQKTTSVGLFEGKEIFVSPDTGYLCPSNVGCISMVVDRVKDDTAYLDFNHTQIPTWISMKDFQQYYEKTNLRSRTTNKLQITGKIIDNKFYIDQIIFLGF